MNECHSFEDDLEIVGISLHQAGNPIFFNCEKSLIVRDLLGKRFAGYQDDAQQNE